jgi:hypothetical protein
MNNTTDIQDLGNGVTREDFSEGQVLIFTIRSNDEAAIDTWGSAIVEFMQTRDTDQPLLVAYDMSHISLNTYIRQKAHEINIQRSSTRPGRQAIIIPPNYMGNAFKAFVYRDLPADSPLKTEFFTDRERALAWLAEGV